MLNLHCYFLVVLQWRCSSLVKRQGWKLQRHMLQSSWQIFGASSALFFMKRLGGCGASWKWECWCFSASSLDCLETWLGYKSTWQERAVFQITLTWHSHDPQTPKYKLSGTQHVPCTCKFWWFRLSTSTSVVISLGMQTTQWDQPHLSFPSAASLTLWKSMIFPLRHSVLGNFPATFDDTRGSLYIPLNPYYCISLQWLIYPQHILWYSHLIYSYLFVNQVLYILWWLIANPIVFR